MTAGNESFEAMLTGGHPNSLGRTEEVVECVLDNPERFDELFACYGSQDEVVRLRVSSAMKRVETANHDMLIPYIDRFISEIGELDQPSAQWTLAQLFDRLKADMTCGQQNAALAIMTRNLKHHDDWIVLNHTMETLAQWARDDTELAQWLVPHLSRLAGDRRKSVATRAKRKHAELAGRSGR